MTTLTWLHLSDLHACHPRFAWDANRVTETLVRDLRHLQHDHGLCPDLLFFTGDAAFGEVGSKRGETLQDQFGHFATFLDQVRTTFKPEIELENVFLVPGNHDVNRRWVSDDQTAWLDLLRTKGEPLDLVRSLIESGNLQWRRYMERLTDYRAFLEGRKLVHLLEDPERLIYAATRDFHGVRVGIAGFNSAWSCCRDGERGRLWMAGKWQQGVLRQKLKGSDFSVALVHHPPDWLVEYESPDFERGLEHDFRFLLHGHEHRAWVRSLAEGYTVVAAGACYERSDTGHNGYNIVRLDLEEGQGEIWLRGYDLEGGGWIPRHIFRKTDDRGVWQLSAPWMGSSRGRSPAIRKAKSIRWLHLSDLHVGCRGRELWWQAHDELNRSIWEGVRRLGAPDLILFTGDLTFSGSEEEFELFDDFLEELLGWIRDADASADPVVVSVPGNHDIQRPKGIDAFRYLVLDNYAQGNDDENVRTLRKMLWNERDASFLAPLFAPYQAWLERRVLPGNLWVLTVGGPGLRPGRARKAEEQLGAQWGALGL